MTPFCNLSIELLGWISGLLVMSSALPNIISNLRCRGPLQPSFFRDSIQCIGNLGWVHYGILIGKLPIIFMCAVSALLMTILMCQQYRRNTSMQ